MRRHIPLLLGLLFPAAIAPLAAQSPTLRLRIQPVIDPMMNNEEAFRLLVPREWRTEGGLVWRGELSNLVYLQLRLGDPQGRTALEFFPTLPFT